MSIEIINPRHQVTEEHYERQFRYVKVPGNAWAGFPCDKGGNIFPLNPCAQENFDNLVAGKVPDVEDKGVVFYTTTYIQNAEAKCVCGQIIELHDAHMYACQCPHCGRWFNLSGQELNPPEMWDKREYYGEEY